MMGFKFQNFNSFQFMFDRSKQPIHVTVPVKDHKLTAKDYDDAGDLIKLTGAEYDLVEPVVKSTTNTQTDPGTSFQIEDGGPVKLAQMEWVSLHSDFTRGTIVTVKESGNSYKVVSYTHDELAGLTTYYLKAVE